jgi:hypothetical protein
MSISIMSMSAGPTSIAMATSMVTSNTNVTTICHVSPSPSPSPLVVLFVHTVTIVCALVNNGSDSVATMTAAHMQRHAHRVASAAPLFALLFTLPPPSRRPCVGIAADAMLVTTGNARVLALQRRPFAFSAPFSPLSFDVQKRKLSCEATAKKHKRSVGVCVGSVCATHTDSHQRCQPTPNLRRRQPTDADYAGVRGTAPHHTGETQTQTHTAAHKVECVSWRPLVRPQ